jgi:hypothetical protein
MKFYFKDGFHPRMVTGIKKIWFKSYFFIFV